MAFLGELAVQHLQSISSSSQLSSTYEFLLADGFQSAFNEISCWSQKCINDNSQHKWSLLLSKSQRFEPEQIININLL